MSLETKPVLRLVQVAKVDKGSHIDLLPDNAKFLHRVDITP
jgi:hypothetical protein